MKEKLNERKAKLLTIVAVVLLLVIVIGAAYAYFLAQVGNGTNTDFNVLTGTTDNLTFEIEKNLNINATVENFGRDGKTLSESTYAKATLMANNATNYAKESYNIYYIFFWNFIIFIYKLIKMNFIIQQKNKNQS